jgi:transcriptional regulator with XRE-family HTH domain
MRFDNLTTRLPATTLLGQNVARLCEQQGLSLTSLAGRLGWCKETLRDLEAGALDISLDELDQLCLALDAAPQDLFSPLT